MAKQKDKSGKWDRNRKSGQNLIYRSERRHDRSHVRRIRRHLERHGFDPVAVEAAIRYATNISLNAVRSIQEFIKDVRNDHQTRADRRHHGDPPGSL